MNMMETFMLYLDDFRAVYSTRKVLPYGMITPSNQSFHSFVAV
jgi:hypothetical protein